MKPKCKFHPDILDCFFSCHVGTKPRLILRLTGKVILFKVKTLLSSAPSLLLELISMFDNFVLHKKITEYIESWDTT